MQGTTLTRLYDSYRLNWQPHVLSVTKERAPDNHKQEEMRNRKWMELWEELLHPTQKVNQGSHWTYSDLWTNWSTCWYSFLEVVGSTKQMKTHLLVVTKIIVAMN